MRRKLYIAYGSNLNKGQMAWRCPTARYVGTGMVEGYELKFKGRPEGAYATIDPKKGGKVPVAIWEIQPYDEFRLNQYEGYPNHYFTRNIPVKIGNHEVTGMVYIMNKVDLARQRVLHHAVKAVTVGRVAAGDSFVCVHRHKLPVAAPLDVIGVIIHLRFVAALLFLMVCTDSGVSGYLPLLLRGERRSGKFADGSRYGRHSFSHKAILPLVR